MKEHTDEEIKINWKTIMHQKLANSKVAPKTIVSIIETQQKLFEHLLADERRKVEDSLLGAFAKVQGEARHAKDIFYADKSGNVRKGYWAALNDVYEALSSKEDNK